jgi:hypothetical protein
MDGEGFVTHITVSLGADRLRTSNVAYLVHRMLAEVLSELPHLGVI